MSPPCSFSPSSASSSSDIPSQNGQVLAPRPLPTWEEIRAAVPKECFEKSLLRSLYYLAIDLLVIGFLYAVVPFVETKFGLIGLFFWYCLLGMFLSSLFCVGHDCGHGTFSDWTWVNDIFGHISHALLMVPFWPWQKSHRQHHQFTSHVDKDKGHPWVLEDDYEGGGWLRKHFAKIPLSGLIRWNPIYTVAGLPDGSHFWPFSRLFSNNTERFKCAISSSLCLLTSWAIFVLLDHSPWAFLKYYYVPLMFQGYWMVIITYLQHQDEQIEVYEEGNWAFVKGQLQTYDREYGFGIDHAMHHITDGHVAHHFFFTRIPHYHLPEATKSIRKIMEKYPGAYKRKSNYDFLLQFLWMNVKLDCLVGKGSGLLKYRTTARREERQQKED